MRRTDSDPQLIHHVTVSKKMKAIKKSEEHHADGSVWFHSSNPCVWIHLEILPEDSGSHLTGIRLLVLT